MKKIYSFIFCFLLLSSQAFAFEDDIVNMLDKELKIKNYNPQIIEDDFVNQTLNKSTNPSSAAKNEQSSNLSTNSEIKNNSSKKLDIKVENNIVEDVLLKDLSDNKRTKVVYKPCDFSNINKTILKISPEIYITTRDRDFHEGEKISFILVNDYVYKNVTYSKGTKITGRIENIVTNEYMGNPASITIGHFKLGDTSLNAELYKIGANRTLWVAPTVYCLTGLFGIGLLAIPIRGGHAKFKPYKTYDLNIYENI